MNQRRGFSVDLPLTMIDVETLLRLSKNPGLISLKEWDNLVPIMGFTIGTEVSVKRKKILKKWNAEFDLRNNKE